MGLPTNLKIVNHLIRPIDAKQLHFGKHPQFDRPNFCLHIASVHGICRGTYRTYMLFAREHDYTLYLEELNKDAGGDLFCTKIEDPVEHTAVLDFINFHSIGSIEDVQKNLSKTIKNMLTEKQLTPEEIEKISFQIPETTHLNIQPRSFSSDPVSEKELEDSGKLEELERKAQKSYN